MRQIERRPYPPFERPPFNRERHDRQRKGLKVTAITLAVFATIFAVQVFLIIRYPNFQALQALYMLLTISLFPLVYRTCIEPCFELNEAYEEEPETDTLSQVTETQIV
jgi:hypothetical protein